MAILFGASEPQSFDSVGSVSGTTDASYIDSDFTRLGLLVDNTTARYIGTLTVPQTITTAGAEEIWFHCEGGFTSAGTAVAAPMIFLRDQNGDETGLSNTTPGLRAQVQGNVLGTGVTRPTGRRQFDVQVTAAAVNYYIDGLLQETVAVNLDGTTFSTIEIGGGAAEWGCSEVIVSDTSTIGLRCPTNEITGQGADNAMVGVFSDVDEAATDDADFISSATIGQNESFTTTTRVPVGSQLVPIAVTATFRGRQGTLSGGPTDFDGFLTLGGTRYTIGGTGMPVTFGAGAMIVADQNPATASAWGTEANDIEFGITSKA